MGHGWLISRKVLEASRRGLIFMASRRIGRRLAQISPEMIVEMPWKLRKTRSAKSTSASRLSHRRLAAILFQATKIFVFDFKGLVSDFEGLD